MKNAFLIFFTATWLSACNSQSLPKFKPQNIINTHADELQRSCTIDNTGSGFCNDIYDSKIRRTIVFETKVLTGGYVYYKSGRLAKDIVLKKQQLSSVTLKPDNDDNDMREVFYLTFENGQLKSVSSFPGTKLGIIGAFYYECPINIKDKCDEKNVIISRPQDGLPSIFSLPNENVASNIFERNNIKTPK